MQSKRGWLFPLLVLVELVAIIVLAPANCAPDMSEEKPSPTQRQPLPATKEAPEPVENDSYYQPECRVDDDCPSDSNCLHGTCIITGPTETQEVEDELDAGTQQQGGRYCVGDDDCGCGYQCDNDLCSNATDPFCCANAECGEDEFCHFGEGESNPNGTCMKSECDTSENCDGCGMRCYNHLCKQAYCCANGNCPTGQR